jgi:hypothetical protein
MTQVGKTKHTHDSTAAVQYCSINGHNQCNLMDAYAQEETAQSA